jgi:ribonuclease HII
MVEPVRQSPGAARTGPARWPSGLGSGRQQARRLGQAAAGQARRGFWLDSRDRGLRHSGLTPRRNRGLSAYERVLCNAGMAPVAGIDEAGRGACAGPLVVAAVILDPRKHRRLTGLADSKALTAKAREAAYDEILAAALSVSVVEIGVTEIDAHGLHVCNVAGMRRALAGLSVRPGYVLTDGFPVRGLAVPALAMWQGDEVAACVAAASVIAKVTRDRLMRSLHGSYPAYGFARHKGYSTPAHMRALIAHGPCAEHRLSFANVAAVLRARADGVDPARLRLPVRPNGVAHDVVTPDVVAPDAGLPEMGLPDGVAPDGAVPDGAVPDGAVPGVAPRASI